MSTTMTAAGAMSVTGTTGLDLTLPEELTDLRGLVAQLLEASGAPERLQDVEATDERFDRAAWKVLADAGVIGVATPEEHGGLGLGQCGLHVALAEHGRHVVLAGNDVVAEGLDEALLSLVPERV